MKLLGWLVFGAGTLLLDSAIHNRGPLATLKTVLTTGQDTSAGSNTQTYPKIYLKPA